MMRWPTICFLVVALLVTPAAASDEEYTLERCAERVRDHPDDDMPYRCYWAASRRGQREGAIRALEALLAIDPGNPHVLYYLGHIERDIGGTERAIRLYREAAEGFAAQDQPVREVWARISRAHQQQVAERFEDAEESLAKATEAAERAGDPVLQARAKVFTAQLHVTKDDYGAALRVLQEAERVAPPDSPAELRASLLGQLGSVHDRLGLYRKALENYRAQLEVLVESGAVRDEVRCRYRIAALSGRIATFDGTYRKEDRIRDMEEVLALSVKTGERWIEGLARAQLGKQLGGEEGIAQVERALELLRSNGSRREARTTMRLLGETIIKTDPSRRAEGFRWIDAALEDAMESGHLSEIAVGRIARATGLTGVADRDDWLGEVQLALQAVENIRDLQPDGRVRSRVFDTWAYAYYRFSGFLLERVPKSPDPDQDIDQSLRIIERMRARVLLDELDRAGIHPRHDDGNPDARRRVEVLEEIAGVQKRLADPSVVEAARRADLEELARLEREELALRDAIARSDPAFAALRSPEIPTADGIRDLLDADQAILSFQLTRGRRPGLSPNTGGSWATLLTRDGQRSFALPDAAVLESQVRVFLGLCRRRDGSEAEAAARLFDDVLAEPLGSLDPSVRRLVIVPDGSLHRLPLAALRAEPNGDPFGATYEITQVPSLTLWSKWKATGGEGPAPVPSSVLALADPAISGGEGTDGLREADPWIEGLRLGPLPRARDEARSMVRRVGGASRMLAGADASERSIKDQAPADFSILHFAAHAVVDADHPERSAVVLAPGAEIEDGFLQMREIVDLDLRGKTIILSACSGASGEVVRGEGVLSLARAFFQAGARAVVASLWPMKDDEAAVFMDEFSRQIGRGHSLSGALTRARAARIASGAPVTAWAGLIVLGDGDHVPVPGGGSGRGFSPLWIVAALLVAGGGSAVFLFRRAAARRLRTG
jgi:CHAT domain-containing protein/Flp pilus assembly protein TadD